MGPTLSEIPSESVLSWNTGGLYFPATVLEKFLDNFKIDLFFNDALEQTGTNFRKFCSVGHSLGCRHHYIFATDLLREALEYT